MVTAVWNFKKFSELTAEEFHDMVYLRERVFILEQNCVYHDVDGHDKQSWHLFRYGDDGLIMSSLRILPAGLKYKEASLGRVVTAPEVRRTGEGRALMAEALKRFDDELKGGPLRISAQAYLEKFYGDFGFARVSENYLEDGIPHLEMLRRAP